MVDMLNTFSAEHDYEVESHKSHEAPTSQGPQGPQGSQPDRSPGSQPQPQRNRNAMNLTELDATTLNPQDTAKASAKQASHRGVSDAEIVAAMPEGGDRDFERVLDTLTIPPFRTLDPTGECSRSGSG